MIQFVIQPEVSNNYLYKVISKLLFNTVGTSSFNLNSNPEMFFNLLKIYFLL